MEYNKKRYKDIISRCQVCLSIIDNIEELKEQLILIETLDYRSRALLKYRITIRENDLDKNNETLLKM